MKTKQGVMFANPPVPSIEAPEGGFRFVDLFAGIGGFHVALEKLGGTCVFASEIDEDAIETYARNFPRTPMLGDIQEIDHASLPDFDFLCAGFPCQPFSKGGKREGFQDTRGTLFFDICEMVRHKRPSFLLLENVANLVGHDGGNTYRVIIESLRELGYRTPSKPLLLSPHLFGVPVHRPRIYIPCIREDLTDAEHVDLSFSSPAKETDAYTVVDASVDAREYAISAYEERVLDMWNEFYKGIDLKIIGFPVWAEEFGANYQYENLPAWKQEFIRKNRDLYSRNRKFVDSWLKRHDQLSWCRPSHRKFEWQAGESLSDIYEGLIQFRPSGVRVRRPNRFSTLVAMNHPQIVGRYKRRLSPDEAKALQSFPKDFKMHSVPGVALKQLGNAVNTKVVKEISKKMLAMVKR